jgi:hypothetical protein
MHDTRQQRSLFRTRRGRDNHRASSTHPTCRHTFSAVYNRPPLSIGIPPLFLYIVGFKSSPFSGPLSLVHIKDTHNSPLPPAVHYPFGRGSNPPPPIPAFTNTSKSKSKESPQRDPYFWAFAPPAVQNLFLPPHSDSGLQSKPAHPPSCPVPRFPTKETNPLHTHHRINPLHFPATVPMAIFLRLSVTGVRTPFGEHVYQVMCG